MQRELSPLERARRADLVPHPNNEEACAGCIYYATRTDGEGYCSNQHVRLNVGANWWCNMYDQNGSTAKLTGHPLHPMLIPFPLALTGVALVFDILAETRPGHQQWRRQAKNALIAGTVGGLLAAPVGLMDWLSLPAHRPAKPYGLVHGLGNALLLGLNGLNISMRTGRKEPSPLQRSAEIGLSVLANILAFGTGWLGGQLSYRFGVGVEPPTRPYRILDVKPVARLTEGVELEDGHLQIPAEPVWNGPVIPSQPLPAPPEEWRAAS